VKKRAILFVLIAAPVCLLCPVIIAAAHTAGQARKQAANTVWGRYDFHVGERLTNCGFNSIQLLRTNGGWKIVNIASTILTAGCTETK
jgi:hypothetical protein